MGEKRGKDWVGVLEGEGEGFGGWVFMVGGKVEFCEMLKIGDT